MYLEMCQILGKSRTKFEHSFSFRSLVYFTIMRKNYSQVLETSHFGTNEENYQMLSSNVTKPVTHLGKSRGHNDLIYFYPVPATKVCFGLCKKLPS